MNPKYTEQDNQFYNTFKKHTLILVLSIIVGVFNCILGIIIWTGLYIGFSFFDKKSNIKDITRDIFVWTLSSILLILNNNWGIILLITAYALVKIVELVNK